MELARAVTTERVILTEGALIERLRRDSSVRLDPEVLHAGFVYDAGGRAALERLYRGYLDVGRESGLPMVVCSPTWRASPERVRAAGFDQSQDVNGDGVRFVQGIRAAYGEYGERVCIGGLMGCRGDAYDPREALAADEAAVFHRAQTQALAAAGADFLMAATLPALSEAVGIARAMAAVQTPYVLSFVVRAEGTLLDGTPLQEAVRRIDADVRPPPVGYMANCVHPAVLAEALERIAGRGGRLRDRLIGLQGNTSRLRPEELDGRAELEAEDPAAYAAAMAAVHKQYGLRILGGCCGTDERHIRAIAEAVTR